MNIEYNTDIVCLDNIELGRAYKNWREFCNVVNIDYDKYKKGGNKVGLNNILNKIYKINNELDNYSKYSFSFEEIKISNPTLYLQLYNCFKFKPCNILILEYLYKNNIKSINYIDFIDSKIIDVKTYLSMFYYLNIKNNRPSNKLLMDNISAINDFINNKDIPQQYYKILKEDCIANNHNNNYIVSGFDNNIEYHKSDTLEKIPESIKINDMKFRRKNYIKNTFGNLNVTNYYKNSIHANKSNYREYSINKNNNKTNLYKNNILKYCKHIESYYPQNYYIYKYTNKLSNLVYIGITSRLYDRQKERLLSPSSPFDYTLKAIGIDNFEFSIIDYAEDEDRAKVLENKYIDMYDSKNNGYNMVINKI